MSLVPRGVSSSTDVIGRACDLQNFQTNLSYHFVDPREYMRIHVEFLQVRLGWVRLV